MNGISSLAAAAYRFHVGECERLKDRVNTLCAIVNSHPDRDDIYANMPIVVGEFSGDITIEGYQALEEYFTEVLAVRLEAAA